MANEKLEHVSDYSYAFDEDGQILSKYYDQILNTWKEINAEAEKNKDSMLDTADAYQALLDDMHSENKAAHAKELKDRKDILKIELQIINAKEKGDSKAIKQLEKRLALVKTAQEVEKKTQEVVKKYSEDMEARERLRNAQKQAQAEGKKLVDDGLKSGDFKQTLAGLKLELTGGQTGFAGVVKSIDTMTHALAGVLKSLNKSIEEIASYKSDWDTRLFGSDSTHTSLVSAVQGALGASPYAKQSEVLKNIDKAIDTGIAYNIEQRAFLQTIKDDIAGTFDAFDSTLLQIIRVQQSDSTAARMGMEASLNEYLNKMFANTEYLNSLSDTVTGALYQATSLLSSEQSIGFEYQVQKWLGSLYSVGMSQGAIQNLATALGQLASGDVSGTTTGAGKLLVMAAARSGLNYSELLTEGINDSDINKLLANVVDYLGTIADSNKVVQSQLANVFGMTTSDIQAAKNLQRSDIQNIYGNTVDYNQGISSLNQMASSIWKRMSLGEMMQNVMDNFNFTLASGIAENPVLYSLWSISNMLDELVAGIPIPTIGAWAMGNGTQIDLEATVSDLMRVGTFSVSLLSGIGSLINGLGNNANGLEGVLKALEIGTGTRTSVTRGGGNEMESLSLSNYQGNSSGDDIFGASMAGAEDQKNELAVDAAEGMQDEVTLEDVNNTMTNLLELFTNLTRGNKLVVEIGDDFNFAR